MALILNIDTAMENAGICLSEGETVIGTRTHNKQMEHAGWIHTAINDLLKETGRSLKEVQAVAVTEGPGSYTGLRVGMATAKGLCFALDIPLITESTLRLIAFSTLKSMPQNGYSLPLLVSPMIDARRMEVFTSLFNDGLSEQMKPCAMILEENSFSEALKDHVVVFSGNGSAKWQTICNHINAKFSPVTCTVEDLAVLAAGKYRNKVFAELAYAEPVYLKNVYTGK